MNSKNSKILSKDYPTLISFKPVIRVLFFLLLCTYSYNHIFKMGLNIYLSDFFVVALLLFSMLEFFTCRRIHNFSHYFMLFTLLFFYYSFLLFYSYAFLGSGLNEVLGRFRMLFFYPLLFFCGLITTNDLSEIEIYYTIIKIHVLVSVILGIISFNFPGFESVQQFKNSESGVIVTQKPYFMLVTHGTALLCCLVFIREFLDLLKKSKKVPGHIFFIVISLSGILGTQNRGIWIVFLLSILLLFFYTRKSEPLIRSRAKKVIIIFIIVLIAFLLVIFHSPLYKKFENRIDETVQTFTGEKAFFKSITGIRVARTMIAFREWLKTPILGCGWGNQIRKYEIYGNFS